MIRSRDYVLFLLTVVFLLIGIGATFAESYRLEQFLNGNRSLSFADSTDIERTAIVADDATVSRADRLAELREKILSYGLVTLQAPESAPEVVVAVATSTENLAQPILCPGYQVFSDMWPTGVQIEEQEGARVVFVPKTTNDTTGTTTTFVPSREILAELPIRSASQGGQNCLPSDVVGITLGGAVIKNNFAYAYAGWGEDALIGYALDGYPIYGVTQQSTDACGGIVANGEYRYQLVQGKEAIITCFSGNPVAL